MRIVIDNKLFTENSLVKALRLPNKCKLTDYNFNINNNLFIEHQGRVDLLVTKLDALILNFSDYELFKDELSCTDFYQHI